MASSTDQELKLSKITTIDIDIPCSLGPLKHCHLSNGTKWILSKGKISD